MDAQGSGRYDRQADLRGAAVLRRDRSFRIVQSSQAYPEGNGGADQDHRRQLAAVHLSLIDAAKVKWDADVRGFTRIRHILRKRMVIIRFYQIVIRVQGFSD